MAGVGLKHEAGKHRKLQTKYGVALRDALNVLPFFTPPPPAQCRAAERERQARFQTNVPLDYKEYGFIADNTPQRILQGAGSTRRSAAAATSEPANDGGSGEVV